jgi:F-type H+-transporting ATPase subunit epsilon
MRLKVLLPTQILIDEPASKVVAEDENGFFALLPRHIDFISALVPGLLSYVAEDGQEHFLAVDEGILVKAGPDVLVSTRHAVRGGDLGELRRTVDEQYYELDEHERQVRSSMARLEADLVRRFVEWEPGSHG